MKRALLLLTILSVLLGASAADAQHSLRSTAYNVHYGSTGAQLLDLYLPQNSTPPYPVVLLFHGSPGDKSDMTLIGAPQAVVADGYAAVPVRYRTTFPEAFHDAFCALSWVYANAAQYQLDTQRIALYGLSFGGATVAEVAAISDPTPYLTDCPNSLPSDYALSGVITNSGVFYSLPDEIGDPGDIPAFASIPADSMSQVLDTLRATPPDQWHSLDLPDDVRALLDNYPFFDVSSHEPPFLLIHGLRDNVVPYQDALNFVQALAAQGIRVDLVLDPLAGHVVTVNDYGAEMATFLKDIFA